VISDVYTGLVCKVMYNIIQYKQVYRDCELTFRMRNRNLIIALWSISAF